jgi:hypothetical protein
VIRISILALAAICFSFSASAQGHGSAGGGGPDGDTDARLIRCTDLDQEAKELEGAFVKRKGKPGQTAKDFFEVIDLLAANALLAQMSKTGSPTCQPIKPDSREMEILKEIQSVWKAGIDEPDHCFKMFSKRSWRQKELEFLVTTYEALCGK